MAVRWVAWILFAIPFASIAEARDAAQIYRSAAEAYKARNWRVAADELGDLIAQYPDSQEAYSGSYYAAESHFALKEYAVARRLYQSYLSKASPEAARLALFHLAQCSYMLQELPQAVQTFQQFLASYPADPLNAFILRDLGYIQIALADYASAANHFQRSLSDFPDPRTQDQCQRGIETCQRMERMSLENIETAYRAAAFSANQDTACVGWQEMASGYELRGDVTSAIESHCRALESGKPSPHDPAPNSVQHPKPLAGS
jgi:tetratricopeptide (TPR) repeat protein